MKKAYSKPTMHFESLSVGSVVFSNCEAIANFAEGICSVSVDLGFGEVIEIFHQTDVCYYSAPDMTDMFCYHAPSDATNVFSS